MFFKQFFLNALVNTSFTNCLQGNILASLFWSSLSEQEQILSILYQISLLQFTVFLIYCLCASGECSLRLFRWTKQAFSLLSFNDCLQLSFVNSAVKLFFSLLGGSLYLSHEFASFEFSVSFLLFLTSDCISQFKFEKELVFEFVHFLEFERFHSEFLVKRSTKKQMHRWA